MRPRLPGDGVLKHQPATAQDGPRDASLGYLVTLPSTQAVLQAFQRAWSAKQRILANQPPVKVETLWLQKQDRPRIQQKHVWTSQSCIWVAFSPSGCYLAAMIEDTLNEHRPESGDVDVMEPDDEELAHYVTVTYEVHVYSSTECCKQLARLCTGQIRCDLLWSPSDHLCCAQVRRLICREAWKFEAASPAVCEPSAALIWDPSSLTVLHYLCHEAVTVLRALLPRHVTGQCWSPSGRYLLLHGVPCGQYSGEIQGWLVIVDMTAGRLAAQCSLGVTYGVGKHTDVRWHPDSHGVIFESGIETQDVSVLAQAGFAAGFLPIGLHMHAVGFSDDAKHFVAESEGHPRSNYDNVVLVSCTVNGSTIHLEIIQALLARSQPGPEARFRVLGWLPGSSHLLLRQRNADGTDRLLLTSLGAAPVAGRPTSFAMSVLDPLRPISPSGKFSATTESAHVRVCDQQSGHECWGSVSSGPWWSEQQNGDLSAVLQCMAESLCYETWLPTGLGFICSTSGLDQADEHYQRPALHVYRFA